MSLVSYVPKKGKRDGRICGQKHQKPEIIMDYNASSYSCKKRTLHWPLVIFLDISAHNAFVIRVALNTDWNRGKLQWRQLFLEANARHW
ncbi:unnamed protein product [Oncorhynchus mykiss]|uniref:PiggyBac transposable element-derived protein domain-containing protein n=1 Tax=Oncorhynchus mykiss TaxID=8022 RepID=A0A060W289_ONCMY|nr:unnamed protein product [Oncorhynchus mykiss]